MRLLCGPGLATAPPSTEFKAGLLAGQPDAELLSLYSELQPSAERVAAVAAWSAEGAALAADASSEQSISEQSTSKQPAPEQTATVAEKKQPAPAKASTKAVAAASVAAVAVAKPAASPAATSVADKPAKVAPETVAKASKPVAVAEPPPKAPAKQAAAPVATVNTALAAKVQQLAVQQPEQPEADVEMSEEERQSLLTLYKTMVVKGVLSKTVYPRYAVKRRLQGIVYLQLDLDRQGNIIAVTERKKSRYDVLNKAAKTAVESVEKFPPVPAVIEGDTVSVIVPVKFTI